ncbi:assimilatory sulfite reductase (NADPH) flavoprotein subunit [Photobacterium damselae]|uniref:assimilatory sulfite reductase (NADPH) flavoprotein subunit n=1 Tax=Photobacterium damselae TaxID=38293 RepID=UPI00406798CB
MISKEAANPLTALSPLNDQQLAMLAQTAAELSPQQLAWISGYFWGLSQTPTAAAVAQATGDVSLNAHSNPAPKVTLIYASQTGNAKGVAQEVATFLNQHNIENQVVAAGDYKGKNLAKETYVVLVASTHGEGEAPDDAVELYEFMQSKKAPKLEQLNYAVIGLGDSSYEFFCQTGKDFDAFFKRLGAKAFVPRIDCDVDYSADISTWQGQALEQIQQALTTSAQVVPLPISHSSAQAINYSKQNPFTASLSVQQKITGRNSSKDVRHIEIDLEGSGLRYEPGDSLGIWYQNDPELVSQLLSTLGLDGETLVDVDGETLSLATALQHHYEITAANPLFVTKYAELSQSKRLLKLITNKDKLRQYAAETQIVDVIAEKKAQLTATELLSLLRRLTPRLYSIASSMSEVGEEVHLTVGVVQYQQKDQIRLGGASGFLAQRLAEDDAVKVFVETNNHFKLPENDSTPIIMVGPGTGIAPFRSFLQERDNREASGKNWLLFGDRSFTEDFLYQVEWQKYLKSGLLTQLDVAFSRDQVEKVYVQHRLLEHGKQVWQWLEDGAYFYVCGDASQMAKDVHQALLTLVQQHGNKNAEQAEQYLAELKKAKRYQKDVY